MRLELANFPVRHVQFGRRTCYDNGILKIAKEELVTLILEDRRITSADVDVAYPGEQTRIVNVRDVVEPRLKVSGPGRIFPGIMGPIETVGEGRTHRLSGLTVIPTAQYKPTIRSGTAAQHAGIVDMWGPGSLVTPFGLTINIALILKLADNTNELDAHDAIQRTEYKVAHRLAETTTGKSPQDVDVFELSDVDSTLPRIVYIFGTPTEWHHPITEVAYYGLPVRQSLPIFLHPNELLDGALTPDARRGGGTRLSTWAFLNQPMILKLFRGHGKRLNFLGVIMQRTRFETEHGKQVTAACTSQMARLLGAEGAIVTRFLTSGNNFMDTMLTVQACERKGIRTVLMTPEWGGENGTELPLVFYAQEARGIVATGSFNRLIKMPAPTKVIGCKKGQLVSYNPQDAPYSPWSELSFEPRYITGGIDWLGFLGQTCAEY